MSTTVKIPGAKEWRRARIAGTPPRVEIDWSEAPIARRYPALRVRRPEFQAYEEKGEGESRSQGSVERPGGSEEKPPNGASEESLAWLDEGEG